MTKIQNCRFRVIGILGIICDLSFGDWNFISLCGFSVIR